MWLVNIQNFPSKCSLSEKLSILFCFLTIFFLLIFHGTCLVLQSDGNEYKMTAEIYDRTLKSIESLEPIRLLIKNNTRRFVDVYWIGYDSSLKRYKTIRAQETWEINTFKSHPWMFRDYMTGIIMHVDHKEILWPKVQNTIGPNEQQHCHRVFIHLPLQSLKTIALWTLIPQIRCVSDINRMHIPTTLRNELEVLFQQFASHRLKNIHAARMRATHR